MEIVCGVCFSIFLAHTLFVFFRCRKWVVKWVGVWVGLRRRVKDVVGVTVCGL